MAKKEGGTAARLAKGQKMKTGKPCPICGEITEPIQVIEPAEVKGSTKFRKSFVKLCKCNRAQFGV